MNNDNDRDLIRDIERALKMDQFGKPTSTASANEVYYHSVAHYLASHLRRSWHIAPKPAIASPVASSDWFPPSRPSIRTCDDC
jgi:hypothetical protein